jgi:hypothetical protein
MPYCKFLGKTLFLGVIVKSLEERRTAVRVRVRLLGGFESQDSGTQLIRRVEIDFLQDKGTVLRTVKRENFHF